MIADLRRSQTDTEAQGMDLLERIPPQALEHEASVLGAMILDRAAAEECAAALEPGDFYRLANGEVFRLIVGLVEAGTPVDLVSLKAAAERAGALDRIGGAAYLVHLADTVPGAANAAYYARVVREKALLRRTIAIASRIAADGYEAGVDAAALLDRAQAELVALLDRRRGDTERVELWRAVDAEVARLRAHEPIRAESTGWDSLDARLGSGLRAGELILLAARPSVGKTSFATALARNVASRRAPVAFFSLEMPAAAIAQNLMAQASGENTFTVRSSSLAEAKIDAIAARCEGLRAYPLTLFPSTSITALGIAAEARRMKLSGGLGMVVIDYLQLIDSPAGGQQENRNLEIGRVSRALKRLALALDVPVVALSQMSRDGEKAGRTRPQLSDLRDSGSLEQDADVVMFLTRAGYQKTDDPTKGKTDVIVAKNRNGATGDVSFRFDPRNVSFTEWRPE